MSTSDLLTETFIKGIGKASGAIFVTGIVAGLYMFLASNDNPSKTDKTDKTYKTDKTDKTDHDDVLIDDDNIILEDMTKYEKNFKKLFKGL
jgi:hypothetical protein